MSVSYYHLSIYIASINVLFNLDDEIDIIINPEYNFIIDGKNQDFVIIFDPQEGTPDYIRRWWYQFSRCEKVGMRGIRLDFASIADYNNLKDCIRKNWLMITGQKWEGLEVSLPFLQNENCLREKTFLKKVFLQKVVL